MQIADCSRLRRVRESIASSTSLPADPGRFSRFFGPRLGGHTCFDFRFARYPSTIAVAANGTKFIGSPTQGANGDVTNLSVPGGIVVRFSGQGVWHADGRQLQRVGLQPTVEVHPTLAGIRAGKDEVLDKAIKYLVHGPQ